MYSIIILEKELSKIAYTILKELMDKGAKLEDPTDFQSKLILSKFNAYSSI